MTINHRCKPPITPVLKPAMFYNETCTRKTKRPPPTAEKSENYTKYMTAISIIFHWGVCNEVKISWKDEAMQQRLDRFGTNVKLGHHLTLAAGKTNKKTRVDGVKRVFHQTPVTRDPTSTNCQTSMPLLPNCRNFLAYPTLNCEVYKLHLPWAVMNKNSNGKPYLL